MLEPVDLQCEYSPNPLGVGTSRPRFGWVLRSAERAQEQSAYRILVASGRHLLDEDCGDRWDSGKVASSSSVSLEYRGVRLASGEECFWKVRVWDAGGSASRWSDVASFETGLLEESDWNADWIGAPVVPAVPRGERQKIEVYDDHSEIPAPLLRKRFSVDRELARARAYVSGLGWYELFVNGVPVTERVLDPAATDYDRRTPYVTHDVARFLRSGENVLAVTLGNGWYCPAYGDSPRLRLQLHLQFADGSTVLHGSDASWKVSEGPIKANSIIIGETYDARDEQPGWVAPGYDDSTWTAAVLKAPPGGRMVAQLLPPIRVNETARPLSVRSPAPGTYVFDFGILFAGWAKLTLRGEAGRELAITYAPLLEDSGQVKPLSEGRGRDRYVCRGDAAGEIYEPRFTFHAVRYVQVEGSPVALGPEDAEGRVAYTAVDMAGEWASDNPLLNAIHEAVRRTLKNELYGIQMDCINAEHWGWLEPGSNPGTLYPRLAMPLFWEKFLDDAEATQYSDGVIPDIVPNYPPKGRKTGDPAWAGNYPLVVWFVYRYFDDRRVLESHFESMERWLRSLSEKAEGGLLSYGYYGDHMLPGPAPGEEEWMSTETPPPLIRTAFYYADARIVSWAAQLLGRPEAASRCSALADSISRAFNAAWFDAAKGTYGSGSQTANLLALALGLVAASEESRVLESLVESIVRKHGGHHHTGNVGTSVLMQVLTSRGLGDVMYGIVNRTDYPGWGYMVDRGSTIWEAWGGKSTNDDRLSMAMFTTIDHFLLNDLAGIQGPEYFPREPLPPAFREITIRPYLPADMTWVRASHPTVRGTIVSRWRRTGAGLALEVTIPANTRASVHVPKRGEAAVTVSEGGRPVWANSRFVPGVPGVTGAREEEAYVVVAIGSGAYSFLAAV